MNSFRGGQTTDYLHPEARIYCERDRILQGQAGETIEGVNQLISNWALPGRDGTCFLTAGRLG
jgi:hypothetical protein